MRVRYGAPLFPEEGETHQAFSLRMTQAVAELHDEDRTTWWESLQRAERGETPHAATGPTGPEWRRSGGRARVRSSGAAPTRPGSEPVPRTGGEERRVTIVEEAIRQFGRDGYQGASLDSIATAVGVRKQTLLYYFPHEGGAARGVPVRRPGSASLARSPARSTGKETLLGPRRGGDPRACSGLASEWPEFPMFIREAGRLGPDAFDRFAGVLDPLRQRAIDFLQAGMDTGEIRKQDPAMLLFTLYTAVVGSLTEASVLNAVVGRRHEPRVAAQARARGGAVRARRVATGGLRHAVGRGLSLAGPCRRMQR